VSQSDHGIDAHGAAGGDVTGQEGDGDEHSSDNDKSDWIVGSHTENHGADEARDADQRGCDSLVNDHAENVRRLRAESHANADFVRLAGDRIDHGSVKADHGEQEREQAENRGEAGEEILLRQRFACLLRLRFQIDERQRGIRLTHDITDFRNDTGWRTLGANLEEHRMKGRGRSRVCDIGPRHDFGVHVGELGGLDDADDFECIGRIERRTLL
jgi:hypothetical protein